MVINVRTVSNLLIATLMLVTPAVWSESLVTSLGSFSNQRQSLSADPHIEGYTVTLYRQNQIIFGRVCLGTGIELACAPIKDAAMDARGKISFQSVLSVGREISKDTGPEGKPALRSIEFHGQIKHKALRGNLSVKNADSSSSPIESKTVNLKRIRSSEVVVQSYEEWSANPLNKPIE